MTDDKPKAFLEPVEEVKRAIEQLELLRADMRVIAASMNRIEKSLRSLAPSIPRPPPKKADGQDTSSHAALPQLKGGFEEWVRWWRAGESRKVDAALQRLSSGDALALASELGVSNGRSPQSAKTGIRSRVAQAAQITMVRAKDTKEQDTVAPEGHGSATAEVDAAPLEAEGKPHGGA